MVYVIHMCIYMNIYAYIHIHVLCNLHMHAYEHRYVTIIACVELQMHMFVPCIAWRTKVVGSRTTGIIERMCRCNG